MNDRKELDEFAPCVQRSFSNLDLDLAMFLVGGSTAPGEMTKYSDVDGTVFLEDVPGRELDRCVDRFEALAEQEFDKITEGGFYEPHWSL